MEHIKQLFNFIKKDIRRTNINFIKRKNKNNNDNKLDFKSVFYGSLRNLNSKSLKNVITKLEIENVTVVSQNALVKKRNYNNTHLLLKKINDNLIKFIYNRQNKFINNYNFSLEDNKPWYVDELYNTSQIQNLFINNTKKRFVGIDGFQINLNKSLINNDTIKASKSYNYGVSIISNLFDIINGININYQLINSSNDLNKKKVNETEGLLKQLHYLSANDVLVMDRWYYSKDLCDTLNRKNIGYIFRMKNNSRLFRKCNYEQIKIVRHLGKLVKICKYRLKNEDYCILTSIIEHITVNEIKALYWKRWKVETDNKKFKLDILTNDIRAKKINSYLLDLECIRFISILSSFIEYVGKETLNKNKKITSNNCIEILYENLLYLFLCARKNNNTLKKILRIIGIVYKNIIDIVYGRNYKRRRIKPSSKWNENGNRYGGNYG